MEGERFTKDDFHRLLNIAELSKKEFSALTGVSYSGVRNWTVGDKSPPYWVKSWLENYIAAKASKINPVLAPFNDWVGTYLGLLSHGNADDMHVYFRRTNDSVLGGKRLVNTIMFGQIFKRGEVVNEFKPIRFAPVIMNEEAAKNAEKHKYIIDLPGFTCVETCEPKDSTTSNYVDIPYYSDDTPDAK